MTKHIIFAGRLRQCLMHYMASQWSGDHIKALAQFAGVTDATVTRWANHNPLPVGLRLLKLYHYLEFMGYEISELRQFEEVTKELGAVVAFAVGDLSTIAQSIGFGGEASSQKDQLMQVLLYNRGNSPERLKLIERALSEHEHGLHKRREEERALALSLIVPAGKDAVGPVAGTIRSSKTGVLSPDPPRDGSQTRNLARSREGVSVIGKFDRNLVIAAHGKALIAHAERVFASNDAAVHQAFLAAMGGKDKVRELAEILLVLST